MDHLDAIENLRQGIGLRGYGQRDPLVEYKNEAFGMFENLVKTIDDQIVHTIFKVQIQPAIQHEHIHVTENTPPEEISQPKVDKETNVIANEVKQSQSSTNKKLGRNDPCWCGSGKKWKKCHYPQ